MPGKVVERTCALGHKYTGTISRGLKCPYCNNLKLLKGFNDLSTTHPNLALDWSSNNQTAACEVTSVSAYRAEWSCHKCKYTWFTAVRFFENISSVSSYMRTEINANNNVSRAILTLTPFNIFTTLIINGCGGTLGRNGFSLSLESLKI